MDIKNPYFHLRLAGIQRKFEVLKFIFLIEQDVKEQDVKTSMHLAYEFILNLFFIL